MTLRGVRRFTSTIIRKRKYTKSLEGELELTIDGVKEIARPGVAAVVPANVRHSVKVLTDGKAIIVDSPVRSELDSQGK